MFNSKKDLVYGNLNKESLKYLKMDNIFTQYFEEFSNTPFNDLFQTSAEITNVIKRQRDAENSPKWKAIKKFIFQCDMDLDETLKINLKKLKIPFDDDYINFLVSTSMDLGGLVMQLKNHYQRPRPFQVAYYTNQPLHPFETQSGNTPSYPSGHAMQGKFLTKIISSHYPKKKIELTRLSEMISDSRIIMGVHYESDNKFGELIANKLLAKDDIKKRFDLD
tara:strand:+ start:2727 stop:3389 length:663 start_codon:yes stop_codon:yes gene_type:complete